MMPLLQVNEALLQRHGGRVFDLFGLVDFIGLTDEYAKTLVLLQHHTGLQNITLPNFAANSLSKMHHLAKKQVCNLSPDQLLSLAVCPFLVACMPSEATNQPSASAV